MRISSSFQTLKTPYCEDLLFFQVICQELNGQYLEQPDQPIQGKAEIIEDLMNASQSVSNPELDI